MMSDYEVCRVDISIIKQTSSTFLFIFLTYEI